MRTGRFDSGEKHASRFPRTFRTVPREILGRALLAELPSGRFAHAGTAGHCLQNVATFDSAIRLANLIGSMNVAFNELRSASVTPRATLQAPQTKTGILPLIFATSSGSGGKPKP